MGIVDLIIKYSVLLLCTYFVTLKIINYRGNTKRKLIVLNIVILILSVMYPFIKLKISPAVATLFVYIAFCMLIKIIINKKLNYSFLITLFSVAITNVLFFFATIINAIVSFAILKNAEPTFFDYLSVDIMTVIFVYLFLKVKRIKYGLSFLQDDKKVENVGTIVLVISGIIVFVTILLGKMEMDDPLYESFLFYLFVVISIFVIIWIRREIKNYYIRKVNIRTIENLQVQINELTEEIKRLNMVAKINHKTNHEINVLRNRLKEMTSEEAVIELNKLSDKYSKEVKSVTKKGLLQLTNIKELDDVLDYMQSEATKNNINFVLKLNGSINYMVKKCISKERLATLLSDHIKDAIIAVNSSNNPYKSITVILGEIDECYGLCIYDTGVSFKAETLVSLGLRATTTHAKDGGTGFGFMTTFDTLNETRASIVIDERRPKKYDYTKSVSILFDNKKEYRIVTYRMAKIKSLDIKKRIIIGKTT